MKTKYPKKFTVLHPGALVGSEFGIGETPTMQQLLTYGAHTLDNMEIYDMLGGSALLGEDGKFYSVFAEASVEECNPTIILDRIDDHREEQHEDPSGPTCPRAYDCPCVQNSIVLAVVKAVHKKFKTTPGSWNLVVEGKCVGVFKSRDSLLKSRQVKNSKKKGTHAGIIGPTGRHESWEGRG